MRIDRVPVAPPPCLPWAEFLRDARSPRVCTGEGGDPEETRVDLSVDVDVDVQTKYYESMDHLNKFLMEKHLNIIDPELCSSLRMFYRFSHHTSSSSGHMHEVLNHISPTLKGKVAWRVRTPRPLLVGEPHECCRLRGRSVGVGVGTGALAMVDEDAAVPGQPYQCPLLHIAGAAHGVQALLPFGGGDRGAP